MAVCVFVAVFVVFVVAAVDFVAVAVLSLSL